MKIMIVETKLKKYLEAAETARLAERAMDKAMEKLNRKAMLMPVLQMQYQIALEVLADYDAEKPTHEILLAAQSAECARQTLARAQAKYDKSMAFHKTMYEHYMIAADTEANAWRDLSAALMRHNE